MTTEEISAQAVKINAEAAHLNAETNKLLAEERNQMAQAGLANKKTKWYEGVLIAGFISALIAATISFTKIFLVG